MRVALATIRILAVLLGLFWITASILDSLGVLPYSQETPALARRIAHSLPLVASGLLLVVPYRTVRSAPARAVMGAGLCLGVGWILSESIGGVGGYMAGSRSWHVVPVAVAFPALMLANLWAFARITSGVRDAGR